MKQAILIDPMYQAPVGLNRVLLILTAPEQGEQEQVWSAHR